MQVVDETVVLPQFLLVEKIVEIPEVVDIPVVTQRLILMVQTVLLTTEISSTVAGRDKDSLHPTVADRGENRRDP